MPTDATDIALAATETQLDQSWSFTTGERSGDAPDMYYRDLASFVTGVDVNATLPYAGDTVHDSLDEAFGENQATFTSTPSSSATWCATRPTPSSRPAPPTTRTSG